MTLFESEPLPPVRRASRKSALVWSILSTALAIAVVSGGVYLVQHPQPILDQVTVWQFEPPAAIESHVDRLKLTDHGRFLYYASEPGIKSASAFSEVCPNDEDEASFGILGCYLPRDKSIHLFDVVDERLDGTEEVTAAHELLHAAWDRMSADERAELERLIEAEAATLSDDLEFQDRMEYYSRTEPGERANELHSIIGTEVAELGSELEKYYAKYFIDRTIVTDLHAAANAVFVDLKERTEALVASMDALRIEIEADYTRYTAGYDQLNRDISGFNSRAQAGDFESPTQFEQERAALNRRQANLDALFATITERSNQFETKRSELQTLNAVSAELQRGLNIGGEAEAQPQG